MRSTLLLSLLILAWSAPAADEVVVATINLEHVKEAVGVDVLAIYFMDEDAMAEYKELVRKRQELTLQKKDAGLRDGERLTSELKKIDGKMEDMREEAGLSNVKKLNRALVRYIKKTHGGSYAVILDARAADDNLIIHTSAKVEDITSKAIELLKGK